MPLAKIDTNDKAAQLAAIAALPLFSARVYAELLNGLYAEPGFSDIETADIAANLGKPVGVVAGSIGYLVEIQLVYVEHTTVNRKKHAFLHAYAHENGYKDEALAAVQKAIDNKRVKPRRASRAKSSKPKTLANLPLWKIKMADKLDLPGFGQQDQWLTIRAEDATQARQKAIRDGHKVTGRAYPAK